MKAFLIALALLPTFALAGNYDNTVMKPCPEVHKGMMKAANDHAAMSCRPYKVKTATWQTIPGTLSCRVTGHFECSKERVKDTSPPSPSPQPASRLMIQQCEVKDLRALGYDTGNRHEYCLAKGYNGGHVNGKDAGYCWKSTTSPTSHESDCPRLNSYYQSKDGFTCQHLTSEDAKILGVCGR